MFVSVIVPVYNAQAMLPRCIESVLSQKEASWELLLMNDGSTDDSAAVCQSYADRDSRIRLFNSSNQGVSHARNTGIDQARGDYLYFLDADDYLAPDAFAQLKQLVADQPRDVVFTAFYKEYKSGSEFISVHQGEGEPNPYHTRLLGTVWGKLYRREFVGQQRFDRNLHLCEDAEFNYRLLPNAQSIGFCEAATYHYVYYGGSAVRGYQPQRVRQYEEALERIRANDSHSDPRVQDSINAFTCNVFCVITMNNLFHPSNKTSLGRKFRTLWSLTDRELFKPALAAVKPGTISRQQALLIKLCRARFAPGIWAITLLNRLRNKRLNY